MTTLAGRAGIPGSANGTGSAARFSYADGAAVDITGNLYVTDQDNSTIRQPAPVLSDYSRLRSGLAMRMPEHAAEAFSTDHQEPSTKKVVLRTSVLLA